MQNKARERKNEVEGEGRGTRDEGRGAREIGKEDFSPLFPSPSSSAFFLSPDLVHSPRKQPLRRPMKPQNKRSFSRVLRVWSKSKERGGPEENGGWVSKFRALQRGGSSHFSASQWWGGS